METMIERVAKAMEAAAKASPYEFSPQSGPMAGAFGLNFEAFARTAIEAMREPTEAMKLAEGPSGGVNWGYSCHVCGGVKDGWELMMEAALKPPTK